MQFSKPGNSMRRWSLVCAWMLFVGCIEQRGPAPAAKIVAREGVFHVHPGDEIQAFLDAAAEDGEHKIVRVHSGVYRPSVEGQALIQFNARHEGITLEAEGLVTLTAANEEIADERASTFPAVVNHVVYFGDGISRQTILRGFRITGARGFVTRRETQRAIEPNSHLDGMQTGTFFFSDGGAVKIFGRSYPTLSDLEVVNNETILCGGGVSVEHRGGGTDSARFVNCVFRDNRCPGTGSAIDLLEGSSAVIENCLFVENIANTGMDEISRTFGLTYNSQHGCGALTVFPGSRAVVRRCTFTGNWNGADDRGEGSVYSKCIFWQNIAHDGSRPGGPYEIDILDARNVEGCFFNGATADLRGEVDAGRNVFDAPDPRFDGAFRPLAPEYSEVGYRAVVAEGASSR